MACDSRYVSVVNSREKTKAIHHRGLGEKPKEWIPEQARDDGSGSNPFVVALALNLDPSSELANALAGTKCRPSQLFTVSEAFQ
ncbi:hypothetical protein [Shewanella woodyi]|uniref:hypothetical protein n=1 Tax=Shewanella woodyi TaxID=60961 RepID=UPI00374857C9